MADAGDQLPASSNGLSEARLVLQKDRIVACNRAAQDLFQSSQEELLGQSLLDYSALIQPGDQLAIDVLRKKALEAMTEGEQQFKWVGLRPSGETFLALATVRRLDARGKTFSQFSLTASPAEESETADTDLNDSLIETLTAEEIKDFDITALFDDALLNFKRGIEQSSDAIFLTDVEGTITYVNPAFESIYGYDQEEAIGQTPRILKSGLMKPEEYEAFWQKLLARNVVTGEIINRRKDGQLLHIEGTNSPIVDDEGRLVGYLGIHRDITARKQAEEALRNAQEDLEEQLGARTDELSETAGLLQERNAKLEQLNQVLVDRNRILTAMLQLWQHISAGLDVERVFASAVEVAADLLDVSGAYLSEIDLAERQATVVAEHYRDEAVQVEQGSDSGAPHQLSQGLDAARLTVRQEPEPYVLQVDDETLSPAEREHMIRNGVMSILSVPLVVEGAVAAELTVWEGRRRRDFGDEEIALVQSIARQVTVAIDNARLSRQVQREVEERRQLERRVEQSVARRERQMQLSAQLSRDIVTAADLNELYERVVLQLKEQFGFYHVQLLRYEPAVDALVLIAGYGKVGRQMRAAGHRLPVGAGLIGKAAAQSQAILRPVVAGDPDWRPNPLLPNTKAELAVPIVLGDEVLGVLDVQSDVEGGLSADDLLVLEGLSGQIAIAIESTRLRQEMADRLQELSRLQRVMSREGWQTFRAQLESRPKGYRFSHASVEPVAGPEMPGGQRGEAAAAKQDTVDTGHVVTTPMTVRGQIIGSLGIQDDPEHPLSREDRELIESISVQVAEALESARLLEQTQKHAIEMEAVAQVSAAASTILDAHKLLSMVAALTKERFDLYHVAVFILNDAEMLEWAAGTDFPVKREADEVPPLIALSQEQSLIARAARSRQPVVVHDVRSESGYLPYINLPDTRSEMAVPLVAGGEVLGVLDLQSDVAHRFSDDDVRIHTTLGAQVAVALQNANLYAKQLETTERLREVDRLKTQFLASMSHELRTPLNSIIGFADVLLEGIDGPLNERMEEDVKLIRDSGRHLRSLIGEMLDMSKIEAGMMELRYEPVDIPSLAKEIMANANSLALDKELEIKLELDQRLDIVEADRTRLTQVLLNLMSNAIKFTRSGSVVLSMSQSNGDLLVAVKDTGIGIRHEDIPAIFEQFRQVDGSMTRQVGGTGLGLPISKSLVELHGGEMWVESEVNVGSTFWFTIPKEKPPASKVNLEIE